MKIRHLKTQNNIYIDHLTSERPLTFDNFKRNSSHKSTAPIFCQKYPTNFSLTLKNPYLFVLLHLRKDPSSKNKLGISIPDICIFDKSAPYDVLYSHDGDIKSIKASSSIRLKQVYSFFKQRSFEAKTKKEEMGVACFQNEDFLILSDADLFITCCKHRTDPFFQKMQYLRNKVNLTGTLLQIPYDESTDYQFTAAATECFAGYNSEQQMLEKYGQEKYLRYCNQKIALFLNYEQNIRIRKAVFCYSKGECKNYFLTNVKQMVFHNLTEAIQLRQKKLQQREAERIKMLEMSNQKYERYKSEQSKPSVRYIETQMNRELFKITEKLSLKSAKREAIQEEITDAAFRKFYPKKTSISQLIISSNFTTLRKELVGDKEKMRLSRPSKFMKKCYKLDKRITATYTPFPIQGKI